MRAHTYAQTRAGCQLWSDKAASYPQSIESPNPPMTGKLAAGVSFRHKLQLTPPHLSLHVSSKRLYSSRLLHVLACEIWDQQLAHHQSYSARSLQTQNTCRVRNLRSANPNEVDSRPSPGSPVTHRYLNRWRLALANSKDHRSSPATSPSCLSARNRLYGSRSLERSACDWDQLAHKDKQGYSASSLQTHPTDHNLGLCGKLSKTGGR